MQNKKYLLNIYLGPNKLPLIDFQKLSNDNGKFLFITYNMRMYMKAPPILSLRSVKPSFGR